jgi:hypothetical protein
VTSWGSEYRRRACFNTAQATQNVRTRAALLRLAGLGISLPRHRLKKQSQRGPSAKFAITLKRKDDERALDLPLSPEALGELAIQASFQGMKLPELIARLLSEVVKKDMVGTILDDEERRAKA